MVVRGPSVGGVARLSEAFNYGGPWSVRRWCRQALRGLQLWWSVVRLSVVSPGSPRPLIMVVRGPSVARLSEAFSYLASLAV